LCQPSAEMSEIIFWVRVTHYSARWITLAQRQQSNFGATGFISLSCFVSGSRVGAMTCVTAGCARAYANAFRPTNPVAPRIRTFMPDTTLSCDLLKRNSIRNHRLPSCRSKWYKRGNSMKRTDPSERSP